MATANAYIVKHGSLNDEVSVKIQLTMTVANGQRTLHNGSAVYHQNMPQSRIFGIILVDNSLIIHVILSYFFTLLQTLQHFGHGATRG